MGRLASQADDDSSSGSGDEGEVMVGRVEVLLVLRGCGTTTLEHQGASGSRGDSGSSVGFLLGMVEWRTVRGLMMSRLSFGGWKSQESVVLRSTVAIGDMISSFEEGLCEVSGSSARSLGSRSSSESGSGSGSGSLSASMSTSRPMSERAV